VVTSIAKNVSFGHAGATPPAGEEAGGTQAFLSAGLVRPASLGGLEQRGFPLWHCAAIVPDMYRFVNVHSARHEGGREQNRRSVRDSGTTFQATPREAPARPPVGAVRAD